MYITQIQNGCSSGSAGLKELFVAVTGECIKRHCMIPKTMAAMVLTQQKTELQLQEMPVKESGPGEVPSMHAQQFAVQCSTCRANEALVLQREGRLRGTAVLVNAI